MMGANVVQVDHDVGGPPLTHSALRYPSSELSDTMHDKCSG